MGKFKDGVNNAGLMTGNTIATPLRRWGEIGNAVANVLVQWKSSAKNTAEVWKQTIQTLTDNFLNFSKVQGKRYQRFLKWTINLASAVTRRPAMIAWAGVLSALNQWVWKPFTKLAPGKLFKWLWNATRILSKKKGFDFQTYDTHETGKDTRINQIKENRIGFFSWGNSEKKKTNEGSVEEKQPEIKKEEVKKEEVKAEPKVEPKKEVIIAQPVEPKKTIEKPKEDLNAESDMFQKKIKEKDDAFIDKELADRGYGPGGDLATEKKTIQSEKKEKATSISEIEKQRKKEAMDKDRAEIEAKKRKHQKPEDKENLKKEFGKLLENNFTEAWVVARGKKHNKGKNLEEILRKLDKENITFATFIDDEILAKSTKN